MAEIATSTSVPKRKKQAWQRAVILAIEPRTPRIQSFFLAPERPFAYKAGQYLKVRVATENGYTAERSYSLASAPEGGAVIELAIEAMPGGQVSGYFHGMATVGTSLEIRGPLGSKFSWSVREGGPILLIGGGSGLVPLMSMVRHRAQQKSAVPLGLILSAITWEDVLYRDELLELADAKDGFELMITCTRDKAPRPDVGSRRVDSEMVKQMLARLPAAPSGVFVCGSDPFVDNAVAALEGLGVGNVKTESYGE